MMTKVVTFNPQRISAATSGDRVRHHQCVVCGSKTLAAAAVDKAGRMLQIRANDTAKQSKPALYCQDHAPEEPLIH